MATPILIQQTPDLRQSIDGRINGLYDVVALLSAVEDRIDFQPGEDMHNTLRLVQMAKERVSQAAAELIELVESRAEEVGHG